ncbi:hypothetical protein HGP14_13230 [Rhizobium sp. P32RR-XVIII]|uniref:hypothetical protein n=1 Tax=Rhizobium sp. P32RR-XVIII TaxID=2726738 RepID=UPI001456A74A|nr:hypothetical protein [Rhizobium sp. P32RR-XVIII]NLS04318.1 hypothetical protein [Rhizobium sp. P32RR-XVIII]
MDQEKRDYKILQMALNVANQWLKDSRNKPFGRVESLRTQGISRSVALVAIVSGAMQVGVAKRLSRSRVVVGKDSRILTHGVREAGRA